MFYIATGKLPAGGALEERGVVLGKFVERVSGTHRTAERLAEYMSATKTRQDEIKDIGGFVGVISGEEKEGKRMSSPGGC